VTQEEYRGLVRSCREEIRKAEAQLELRLATVVSDNKKCFYKYNNKKGAKESLHPLSDVGGNIATKDEEKPEVLHAFVASVFNSQTGYSQGSQPPVLEDREGEQNKPPIIQEEAVNDPLCHLDTYKSMGPDGIHPRVLRELAVNLSTLTRHVKDNQGIRPSQHVFMKGRSCLTNLIFYDQVTHLVDEGKAVDVVYPGFSKAFDTVPHSILLEKVAAHGLDGSALR